MKHGYCTTRDERRAHWSALGKLIEKWQAMSMPELVAEVKKVWTLVADATRDECVKFLVMDHVEKMI